MTIFGGIEATRAAVPGHLLLAAGLDPEVIYDTKFGRNADVDAAADVISMGGDYAGQPVDANGSMLTVAENFQLVSANAADTAAGTGCREVEITYLDNAGRWSNAAIATNGGALDTGISGIRAFCLRGSRFGSAGSNVGLITLQHISTTTRIFATIAAGAGQSQIAAITVPLGYVGVFEKPALKIDRAGSATADATYFCRREGQNGYVQKQLLRGSNAEVGEPDPGVMRQPALTDVKLRITFVSTTNVDIGGQFNYCFLKV